MIHFITAYPIFLFLLIDISLASRDVTSFCENKGSSLTMVYLLNIKLLKSYTTMEIPDWATKPLVYIDCSKRGLTKIPQEDILQKAEVLNLYGNHIRRIRVGEFKKCKNTISLFLGGNCFKTNSELVKGSFAPCDGDLYIETGAFKNLKHLKFLSLGENYLHQFPSGLPPSLTHLDITAANLGNVTSPLMMEGSQLAVLLAERNCAPFYKDACLRNFTICGRFSDILIVLDLKENNFTAVPKFLLGPHLIVLILELNPIQYISKNDFVDSPALQKLSLRSIFCSTWSQSKPLYLKVGIFNPLKKLRYLDLAFNYVSHIPSQLFAFNDRLEYLDLSCNCLLKTVFNPTFLRNMYHLRVLNVGMNHACLERVPPVSTLRLGDAFSNLTSLEYLILGIAEMHKKSIHMLLQYNAKFYNLDNESFAVLQSSKLFYLNVVGCGIRALQSNFTSSLPFLERFDASFNNITLAAASTDGTTSLRSNDSNIVSVSLPRDIAKRMQNINAYLTASTIINSYVGSFTKKLTASQIEGSLSEETLYLDLSYNQVKYLGKKSFENLFNPQTIILSGNPLHNIASLTFSRLFNLHSLVLVHTGLSGYGHYPTFLEKFPVTSKISLTWRDEGNKLDLDLMIWLKTSILYKPINEVQKLDFSENRLPMLQQQMRLATIFPQLKWLALSNCMLLDRYLYQFLGGLYALEYLDISHNSIKLFPAKLIRNLTNLIWIDLSFNEISLLNGKIFCNGNRIAKMVISHNLLTYIQSGFFVNSRLSYLDLSNNILTRLDSSLFSNHVSLSLSYLDLRWNEFDCSCDIWKSFYYWYISDSSLHVHLPGFLPACSEEVDQYYGGCVACRYPSNMKGLAFSVHSYSMICESTSMEFYAAAFTVFYVIFTLLGTLSHSRWLKRVVFRKVNQEFRVSSVEGITDRERNSTGGFQPSFVYYDYYNDDDLGDWIDTHLLPNMEGGDPSIPLSVVGRNNDCGLAPTQQTLQKMMESHKTIVILSNNFCNSSECRFILSALQELQSSKERDHVILIAWSNGEAPRVSELIQRTLNRSSNWFLRFDVTNDDEMLLFETLRTALTTRPEETLHVDS